MYHIKLDPLPILFAFKNTVNIHCIVLLIYLNRIQFK